jgi:integrase
MSKNGSGNGSGSGGGRRGHGEGSIYQRSDGRWCCQLTLPNGRRRYLYGKTRREVAQALARAQRDVQEGLLTGDGRQKLATYLVGWLESIRPPTLAESTWKRYDEYVRLHILPHLGHVKLAQLQPQQVQQFYTDLQRPRPDGTAGLSSSSVHHTHAVLHRALEVATRFGLIARNVAALVTPPRLRESDIHPLDREEARLYLETVAGARLAALYLVALATGMRQGELLGLHWRDIDLDGPVNGSVNGSVNTGNAGNGGNTGRLSVVSTLYVRKGVATFKTPKTKGSRRQIAFAPRVAEALRAHRQRQRLERLKAGPAWAEHDLAFCTEVGLPLHPSTVYHQHARFLKAAGLPPVRFHDLRHTAATLLLLQNVNPKVVSEMLGHSSVGITLDIYSHVLPDMQQDAAAAMALALGW